MRDRKTFPQVGVLFNGESVLAPLLQYRNFEQILLFKTQRKQLNSKSLAWSPFRKEFQSELQKKLTEKKLYK